MLHSLVIHFIAILLDAPPLQQDSFQRVQTEKWTFSTARVLTSVSEVEMSKSRCVLNASCLFLFVFSKSNSRRLPHVPMP